MLMFSSQFLVALIDLRHLVFMQPYYNAFELSKNSHIFDV